MAKIDEDVLKRIEDELDLQNSKWGSKRMLSLAQWIVILGEEFGEVCRAKLDLSVTDAVDELADCAAVCIAAMRSLMDQYEELFKKEEL